MSRILLLLVFVCSPVIGQNPPDETRETGIADDGPPIQVVEAADFTALIGALQSTVDYLSREAAAQNYPDDYARDGIALQRLDLDAQSSMAVSTLIMAIVAIPSLLIAVAGIIMLGFTLYYTRKASDATDATLRIAEQTQFETRNNSRIELRAYMNLLMPEPIDDNQDGSLGFRFKWENAGNTPAIDAKLSSAIAIAPPNASVQDCHFEVLLNDIHSVAQAEVQSIAKGAKAGPEHVVAADDIRLIYEGSAQLFAAGAIYYSDVFGNHYQSMVCFRIEFEGIEAPSDGGKPGIANWICKTVGGESERWIACTYPRKQEY